MLLSKQIWRERRMISLSLPKCCPGARQMHTASIWLPPLCHFCLSKELELSTALGPFIQFFTPFTSDSKERVQNRQSRKKFLLREGIVIFFVLPLVHMGWYLDQLGLFFSHHPPQLPLFFVRHMERKKEKY